MTKHRYTEVGMDYFDTAPIKTVSEITIDVSPDYLFDVFEDADSWPIWVDSITHVEWTSPKPFGIGTTRTVDLKGNMVGDEVFIAWDRGKLMAFCFTHSTAGVMSAFAELYEVEDLGDNRCHLRWTVGQTPAGLGKLLLPLSKPFLGKMFQKILVSLKDYCENPAQR
jgi:hypothetical protein